MFEDSCCGTSVILLHEINSNQNRKKHNFIILLLSDQNRDVLFICEFSEVLINKPEQKQLKKSQTIRLRLTRSSEKEWPSSNTYKVYSRCVSACVCLYFLHFKVRMSSGEPLWGNDSLKEATRKNQTH